MHLHRYLFPRVSLYILKSSYSWKYFQFNPTPPGLRFFSPSLCVVWGCKESHLSLMVRKLPPIILNICSHLVRVSPLACLPKCNLLCCFFPIPRPHSPPTTCALTPSAGPQLTGCRSPPHLWTPAGCTGPARVCVWTRPLA